MDKKTINILYAEDSVGSATLVKMFTDQLSDELDIVLNLKHIKTYKNLKNEEKNVLEKAYDFLLLDNNLIGGDSEEFIKKILEQGSKTPIISMSGEEEISQKFNLPYIGKVGDIDELEKRLRKIFTGEILTEREKRNSDLQKILNSTK